MRRKKILAGIILSSVVATSLFAANCSFDKKDFRKDVQSCSMMKNKNEKKEHKEPILTLIKELNLSDEQKTKIKDIMVESRKNIKSVNEAFSKNSFDKEKYIDIMNQKRENMLKSKADTIEKVYSLLNEQQKEQLKVLMDLKNQKTEK